MTSDFQSRPASRAPRLTPYASRPSFRIRGGTRLSGTVRVSGSKNAALPMMAAAILAITTLAVAASLSPRVRTLPGTYTTGQYLLLVFCFAAGSMADIGRLVAAGPGFLGFTLAVIVLSVLLQFALMAAFRIDRDTAVVTSVATIMSPPFIAATADRLGNREVLVTGIASGLMGYAVGNYVGIAVTWLLR